MSQLYDVFTANVEAILRSRDISRAVLAERMGVTKGYISQLLNGNIKSPGIDVIGKVAKALGVSPATLLKVKQEKTAV